MTCKDYGFIQAYLDGELSREERKSFALHVENCSACRKLLLEMNELESWTKLAINEVFIKQPGPEVIDTDQAWNQFKNRLSNKEAFPHPMIESKSKTIPQKWSWKTMNNTYKKWIVGTSAAAVLVSTLLIPQVQVAASEFLSIFRINQVEFIKLTEADLRQIENALREGKNGEIDFKDLGKVWLEGNTENQQSFQSVQEANDAGITVPNFPESLTLNSIEVQNSISLKFQLDTKKANKLLKQLKSDQQFDDKLNGKQFGITVPKALIIHLQQKGNEDFSLQYSVMDAPEINAPKDVDLDELRNTVLSLPFFPDDVKRQLLRIDDWKKTLPIPYMADKKNNLKEISINGTKAYTITSEHSSNIIWQKDGQLHMLDAYQSNTVDELMEIAKQLN